MVNQSIAILHGRSLMIYLKLIKSLVQKQIDHQLKEATEQTLKKQGSVPGELAELIHKLMHVEPAKFDWKAYLRRFVGNSSIVYTKKLRRKYNKRYAG